MLKRYRQVGWQVIARRGSHVKVGKGTQRETIPMHKELKKVLDQELLKRLQSAEGNRFMTYHFRVHQEGNGYWAECVELKGCLTQGDSMEDLQKNAEEALNLYLEEPEESTLTFPLPQNKLKGKNIIEVPVEPGIALSVLLRKYRDEHHFTQKDIAQRLGMKSLYSYQRLERKSNPSLQTLRKLKQVFPDLSVDYVLQE